MKTLYIGNVPFSMDESAIRTLLEEYGSVFDVRLPRQSEEGQHRGFAFVDLDDKGAAAAIEVLDGHELKGRKVKVCIAQNPRGGRP